MNRGICGVFFFIPPGGKLLAVEVERRNVYMLHTCIFSGYIVSGIMLAQKRRSLLCLHSAGEFLRWGMKEIEISWKMWEMGKRERKSMGFCKLWGKKAKHRKLST